VVYRPPMQSAISPHFPLADDCHCVGSRHCGVGKTPWFSLLRSAKGRGNFFAVLIPFCCEPARTANRRFTSCRLSVMPKRTAPTKPQPERAHNFFAAVSKAQGFSNSHTSAAD
jgi:hypothetical protein